MSISKKIGQGFLASWALLMISFPLMADSVMFQADLERTGVYSAIGPEEAPVKVWKFDAGAAVLSTPLVHEGMVHFVDFEGGVYTVNQDDGSLIWKKDLGGQPSFQITLNEDVLLVGRLFSRDDNESYLMAIDRVSGEERWRFEIDDYSGMDSPLIYNDKVFLVSMSGYVFALDLESGEESWRIPTRGGLGQLLLSNEVLYYQDEKGEVYAIFHKDGEVLWSRRSLAERDSLFSSPVIQGCCIYVMELKEGEGSIIKINNRSGEEENSFPIISRGSPLLSFFDNVVFFGDDGEGHAGAHGYMNAWSVESGQLIWRFETEGFVRGAAAIAGDTVYFGSGDHHLYAVDRHTGEMKWRYETGAAITSTPAVVDGRIYFGSIDGHVYVLE